MAIQTVVGDPTSIEGARIRGPWPELIDSFVAEGDMASGRLCARGTDPATQIAEMAALPAADVDAIATATVLVAAVTDATFYFGDFDGVIAGDRISPCRIPTITFDASTDWDVAAGLVVTWVGINADGVICSQSVTKATGGGAETLSGDIPLASVISIFIAAGSAATGGAATAGVSNDRVELSQLDYPGLSMYRAPREVNTAARNIADEEAVDIMTTGRMMCVPEHAVSDGDHVYVRVLEAGADLRGQLTGMDGAGTPATYARLAGAHWRTAAAADGLAIVEIGR